jgi:hypothetical protein
MLYVQHNAICTYEYNYMFRDLVTVIYILVFLIALIYF